MNLHDERNPSALYARAAKRVMAATLRCGVHPLIITILCRHALVPLITTERPACQKLNIVFRDHLQRKVRVWRPGGPVRKDWYLKFQFLMINLQRSV